MLFRLVLSMMGVVACATASAVLSSEAMVSYEGGSQSSSGFANAPVSTLPVSASITAPNTRTATASARASFGHVWVQVDAVADPPDQANTHPGIDGEAAASFNDSMYFDYP